MIWLFDRIRAHYGVGINAALASVSRNQNVSSSPLRYAKVM